MLSLDTETENTGEFPTAGQLLRSWAARLRSWLRRQPQPEPEREKANSGQESGTGLLL